MLLQEAWQLLRLVEKAQPWDAQHPQPATLGLVWAPLQLLLVWDPADDCTMQLVQCS